MHGPAASHLPGSGLLGIKIIKYQGQYADYIFMLPIPNQVPWGLLENFQEEKGRDWSRINQGRRPPRRVRRVWLDVPSRTGLRLCKQDAAVTEGGWGRLQFL